jgi:hypothetical protein
MNGNNFEIQNMQNKSKWKQYSITTWLLEAHFKTVEPTNGSLTVKLDICIQNLFAMLVGDLRQVSPNRYNFNLYHLESMW